MLAVDSFNSSASGQSMLGKSSLVPNEYAILAHPWRSMRVFYRVRCNEFRQYFDRIGLAA